MTTPLLLVDVGNTRTKWASATARGAIRLQGSVSTAQLTPRWMTAWAKRHSNKRVVVASVVPAVTRLMRRHFKQAVFIDGSMRGLPLAFAYPRPVELGADRIATAIGAQGRGPAIIVSCGTAIAFSALDRKGRFCGGAIAPGPEAQLRALLGATAQLPSTALAAVPRALGRSTREAIRAGVLLQFQGGVRETVLRLRKEIGTSARVVVTGGHARHVKAMRGLGRVEFRPLLVFEGLRIIATPLPEP